MLMMKRRFEWDMGHRVVGHTGKCRFPHGHRYACEVWLTGDLDELGMIVDFGTVKHRLGDWIDQNLDHAFMIGEDDEELRVAMASLSHQNGVVVPFNPTAENIAPFLLDAFTRMMPQVCGITLWETPNCSVVAGRVA